MGILNMFIAYVSVYNSVMKIVFIAASLATIYFVYVKYKDTNDVNADAFFIEFLLIPCIILALVINHEFTFIEVLWTFSIYLESVAIIPQFFLMNKTGEAESITNIYLFALGSYRALYLINWVYRYVNEMHYDLIPIIAGIVQTIMYCGFFCFYICKVSKPKGKNFVENLTISPLPLSSEDNLKWKETTQTLKEPTYNIPLTADLSVSHVILEVTEKNKG